MEGKFLKNERDGDSNLLTFRVYDKKAQSEIPVGQAYKITKIGEKRTLTQNAYMWKLIGEIGKVEDGHRANDDEIYERIIRMAGAKVEYLEVLPKAVPSLKKVFPIVDVLEYRTNINGKKMAVCKAYYGSSNMEKPEMSSLLNTVMDYCVELEIPVDRELANKLD